MMAALQRSLAVLIAIVLTAMLVSSAVAATR
jgi:hypothetical protein